MAPLIGNDNVASLDAVRDRVTLRLEELEALQDALPLPNLIYVAEDYKLLEFLEASPRRDVYIKRAETAEWDLTALRGTPPGLLLMRDQVRVGLLTCADLVAHIRSEFAERGYQLLRDEAKSAELALALAGIIVAVYLKEGTIRNAA
jgi:hypothetical protein